MTAAYGIISLVALLMIGVCLWVDRKRDINLLALFVSIFVCDVGYFMVSASRTLDGALWGNRIAYLGSVFLPLFMLMMLLNLCDINYVRWLQPALIAVGTAVFLIAASPGYSNIYYKSVSIETVDGATRLLREYGPLHCVNSLYLFGYFIAMIAIVVYALMKKKVTSPLHAAFLIVAVFGNIAIWFIESLVPRNFEFLSVSYIITEALILLLYGIIQEYSLIKNYAPMSIADTAQAAAAQIEAENAVMENPELSPEQMVARCETVASLTNREKDVLLLILENKKRKDIADELCVTESTIKKYTAQIFRKIEVSSRAELYEKLKNL